MLKIIKTIVEDLNNIYPANYPSPEPLVPFLTYNILEMNIKSDYTSVFYMKNDKERHIKQPQTVLSINSVGDTQTQALTEIQRAKDYFEYHAYDKFKDINVVVVSVTPVTDRTVQLVDDYEYRYGFDVFIRVVEEVDKKINYIEKTEVDYNYDN